MTRRGRHYEEKEREQEESEGRRGGRLMKEEMELEGVWGRKRNALNEEKGGR